MELKKLPVGVLWQNEEEHLCALMLMMSEYMEKRASEGREVWGWRCWQAVNVQVPHITLHHTLYPRYALCSQDVELLVSALCNRKELTSGEAGPMRQVMLTAHWVCSLKFYDAFL